MFAPIEIPFGCVMLFNVVDLKDGHSDCGNYIIHSGDDKEQGGADKIMDLTGDRMNWVLSGVTETFSSKILELGVSVTGSAAHWVDTTTLLMLCGLLPRYSIET